MRGYGGLIDPGERIQLRGTCEDDSSWHCTQCGHDEVAEDQDGDMRCASGWCLDSKVACDECGEVGCRCNTDATFSRQVLADVCEARGLPWGPVVREYMQARGIDREWKLKPHHYGDMALSVLAGIARPIPTDQRRAS